MANRAGAKGRTVLGNKPRLRSTKKDDCIRFLESLGAGNIEFKDQPADKQNEILADVANATKVLGKKKVDQMLHSGAIRRDVLDLPRRVLSKSDRRRDCETAR